MLNYYCTLRFEGTHSRTISLGVCMSPRNEVKRSLTLYPKTSVILASMLALSFMPNSFGAVPPQVYIEAVKAYKDCGCENQQGNFDAADVACQKGLKLLAPYEDRLQIGLYVLQSNVKQNKKEFRSAEDLARKAVTLAIKLEGKLSPSYADVVARRAEPYIAQLKYQLAEPLFAEASRAFEVLFNRDPAIAREYNSKYVRSINGLFFCQIAQNDDLGALSTSEKILATAGMAPSETDKHMALASGCSKVGAELYKAGDTEHARRLFEKSVALYNQYRHKSPRAPLGSDQDTVPVPSIISAMRDLGEIYQKSGKVAEGKKLLDESKQWQSLRDTLSK
jgi:tetratricopeptide (TPR) repeat protein